MGIAGHIATRSSAPARFVTSIRESEEMLERKEWQVPFADPFVVTVVGNWDPRRGGHLMLHDDGTMMPLRPGATFVVPAGTKRYGFVPVGEGEHQYMVCQFFHGSVLRWMEKGGMSDPRLDKFIQREVPAALRKWKAYEKIQARRRVLAKRIFSTISDVYSGSFVVAGFECGKRDRASLISSHDLAAVVRRNGHFPTTAGSGGMTAGDTVVAESVAELEERLLESGSFATYPVGVRSPFENFIDNQHYSVLPAPFPRAMSRLSDAFYLSPPATRSFDGKSAILASLRPLGVPPRLLGSIGLRPVAAVGPSSTRIVRSIKKPADPA
ncbi:hypothetical protein MKEN_01437200 [Mycena kentingensis (nom. inval.)]|nr:hypothetical protein MKEN_01437200 [Mycena kentingensis (nom. inval.)]